MFATVKGKVIAAFIFVALCFIIIAGISIFNVGNAEQSLSRLNSNKSITVDLLESLQTAVQKSGDYISTWSYDSQQSIDKIELTKLHNKSFPNLKDSLAIEAQHFSETSLGLYNRVIGKLDTLLMNQKQIMNCLLYTSDAADDMQCVDLGGRRIIKKMRTIY